MFKTSYARAKKQQEHKNKKKSLQHYMSIVEDGAAMCTLKTRFEKKMKRNEKMGNPRKDVGHI